MIGQLARKSGFIGLIGLGCLLLAMQIFGRYEVETHMHFYWVNFQHWLAYGLPEFLRSTWRY